MGVRKQTTVKKKQNSLLELSTGTTCESRDVLDVCFLAELTKNKTFFAERMCLPLFRNIHEYVSGGLCIPCKCIVVISKWLHANWEHKGHICKNVCLKHSKVN